MCGNFAALKDKRKQKVLAEKMLGLDLDVAAVLDDLKTGTLFPSLAGWCVTNELRLVQATWGLVPAWARDAKIAKHTYNARSETVHEKPAFRDAFVAGRCLVPALGWWEWDPSKRKSFVHRDSEEPLFMAGLECGGTFTIVTRAASPELEVLHHRQPVLLGTKTALAWLDRSLTTACVCELFDAERQDLVITPELKPEPAQLSLF